MKKAELIIKPVPSSQQYLSLQPSPALNYLAAHADTFQRF
jgi:hypothetical protein